MNRRKFIMHAALLSAAGVIAPVVAQAQISQVSLTNTTTLPSGTRRFTLKQTYQLHAPVGSSGELKLWIPVPEDAHPFQKLLRLSFNGNSQTAFLTSDNAYNAKTLFASWADSTQPMHFEVEMEIETTNWEPMKDGLLNAYTPPKDIHYPADVAQYLLPTDHIKIDGLVKEYADKIVGQETNPLEKARLIYNWTSANMERDNSVMGCGVGDVALLLTTGKLKGKCTDISSIFVALARAAGIPAREMFGLRLGKASLLDQYSKTAFGSADEQGVANVSGGQHCRAQFYLAGFGWVPCDPADVTKMRLTENKPHNDPAVQAVNDYLFGNWDMNWVGFNYARDFDLAPIAVQTPINNFGYPYAEVDGDPLNYYSPKDFAYDYVSREQA